MVRDSVLEKSAIAELALTVYYCSHQFAAVMAELENYYNY